jgi:hypothetical protein
MLIEDLTGAVIRLNLTNFQASLAEDPSRLIPAGTLIAIKEPSTRPCSATGAECIDVASPTDVVFLDEADASVLGETPWFGRSSDSFEAPKKSGNDHFLNNANDEDLKFDER